MGEKKSLKLDVEANPDQMPKVLHFVEEQMRPLRFSVTERSLMKMSVEEIFMNVADYAYGNEEGRVQVIAEANAGENALELTFIDRGQPFDPLSKEDPDVTLPGKERKQGGLGIFLAKSQMDDMIYTYKEEKNMLYMKKIFKGE